MFPTPIGFWPWRAVANGHGNCFCLQGTKQVRYLCTNWFMPFSFRFLHTLPWPLILPLIFHFRELSPLFPMSLQRSHTQMFNLSSIAFSKIQTLPGSVYTPQKGILTLARVLSSFVFRWFSFRGSIDHTRLLENPLVIELQCFLGQSYGSLSPWKILLASRWKYFGTFFTFIK